MKRPFGRQLLGWGIFVAIMPVLGALVLLALIGAAFGLNYKRLFGGPMWESPLNNSRSSTSSASSWFSFGSGSSDSGSSFDSGSDSSFDGGGGGDSGGGGSDSSW
jgi:uncharacterized membrane protein YgcG